MQIAIELTLPFQSAASSSLSFVNKCRRICGRWLDDRNRRALFTLTGHCDKLPDHLSALAGVPINWYTVKQRSLGLHVSLCNGDSQLIWCLKWDVSYRSTRLMTYTVATDLTRKCYQAPFRFFVWGLGTRLKGRNIYPHSTVPARRGMLGLWSGSFRQGLELDLQSTWEIFFLTYVGKISITRTIFNEWEDARTIMTEPLPVMTLTNWGKRSPVQHW